jgi:hypothetical protein
MITFNAPKHHWNYYLAIERDLENTSRYVEFSDPNLETYSIEFARILFSASSEVDVIMKQLCQLIDKDSSPERIGDYRRIVRQKCQEFIDEEIAIGRYGMKYKPWINWRDDINPNWWVSYNNVKHSRNSFFIEANLKNTVNAVGALLIAVLYFYKYQFSDELKAEVNFKDTTYQLQPASSLIQINNKSYYYDVIVG